MGFLRNTLDGFLSLVAAVFTAGVALVPAWYAHLAIGAGLAPSWAYASVAALVVVGGIMILAFLRKAAGGVSPLRDRRRT